MVSALFSTTPSNLHRKCKVHCSLGVTCLGLWPFRLGPCGPASWGLFRVGTAHVREMLQDHGNLLSVGEGWGTLHFYPSSETKG